jgi:hypothetical protein
MELCFSNDKPETIEELAELVGILAAAKQNAANRGEIVLANYLTQFCRAAAERLLEKIRNASKTGKMVVWDVLTIIDRRSPSFAQVFRTQWL